MPKDEFDIEEELLAKFRALSPKDAAAMTLGAFLGYHGYTPLTALINAAGGAVYSIRAAQDRFHETAAMTPAGPLFEFVNLIFPLFGVVAGGLTPGETPQQAKERILPNLLNATLGSLEALALVQPGTLQGIGEIIPG